MQSDSDHLAAFHQSLYHATSLLNLDVFSFAECGIQKAIDSDQSGIMQVLLLIAFPNI